MSPVVQLSRFITMACLAVTLLVMTGCGKNANNFSKVKTGMSAKEVDDLLGAPKETREFNLGAALKDAIKDDYPPDVDAATAYGKTFMKYWEEGDRGCVVYFQNDSVKAFYSGPKDETRKKIKKG